MEDLPVKDDSLTTLDRLAITYFGVWSSGDSIKRGLIVIGDPTPSTTVTLSTVRFS